MLNKIRQIPVALILLGLLGIFMAFLVFIPMVIVAALTEKYWLAELALNIILVPAIFTLGVVVITLALSTFGGCIYIVVKSVGSIVRIEEDMLE